MVSDCAFEVKEPERFTTGVPNLQDLMPGDLKWSWCNNRNKVHNKWNALESSWSHIPTPSPWKHCLPGNRSPVPQRLGTTVLHASAVSGILRRAATGIWVWIAFHFCSTCLSFLLVAWGWIPIWLRSSNLTAAKSSNTTPVLGFVKSILSVIIIEEKQLFSFFKEWNKFLEAVHCNLKLAKPYGAMTVSIPSYLFAHPKSMLWKSTGLASLILNVALFLTMSSPLLILVPTMSFTQSLTLMVLPSAGPVLLHLFPRLSAPSELLGLHKPLHFLRVFHGLGVPSCCLYSQAFRHYLLPFSCTEF